jgi:hypothetical protein
VTHPFAEQFRLHLETTQQAYVERRVDDYLAGFAEHYSSVQLHSEWGEDKAQLATKIARDIERFELLSMDLRILRVWFSGEIGYAHVAYHTRLRLREDSGAGLQTRGGEAGLKTSPTVLIDRRENILTGEHQGDGRWLVACKIVVRARNYYEGADEPDI